MPVKAGEPVLFAPDDTHLLRAVALLNGVDCHGKEWDVSGYPW